MAALRMAHHTHTEAHLGLVVKAAADQPYSASFATSLHTSRLAFYTASSLRPSHGAKRVCCSVNAIGFMRAWEHVAATTLYGHMEEPMES